VRTCAIFTPLKGGINTCAHKAHCARKRVRGARESVMTDSIYSTNRWRKLRNAKARLTPLCEPCGAAGRVEPMKIVDHVNAIKNGGDPFPPLDELMSLCHACHNAKTASDLAGRDHIWRGYDIEGNPIDQRSDWHGGDDKDGKGLDARAAGKSRTYIISTSGVVEWV